MASSSYSAEIIKPSGNHTSTLIFLHGLGDSGTGWAMNFKSCVPKGCKIICPHATAKPVTLNGGDSMPSWFDIFGLMPDSRQDEAGIKKASEELSYIVAKEIENGIPATKIAIGGFSQGGAVALYNCLTGPITKYGSVLILSSWLPLFSLFKNDPTMVKADKDVSIIQCHGSMDPLVPFTIGQMTNNFLQMLGLTNIQFKVYSFMGHSSCDEEMKDISEFLRNILC